MTWRPTDHVGLPWFLALLIACLAREAATDQVFNELFEIGWKFVVGAIVGFFWACHRLRPRTVGRPPDTTPGQPPITPRARFFVHAASASLLLTLFLWFTG